MTEHEGARVRLEADAARAQAAFERFTSSRPARSWRFGPIPGLSDDPVDLRDLLEQQAEERQRDLQARGLVDEDGEPTTFVRVDDADGIVPLWSVDPADGRGIRAAQLPFVSAPLPRIEDLYDRNEVAWIGDVSTPQLPPLGTSFLKPFTSDAASPFNAPIRTRAQYEAASPPTSSFLQPPGEWQPSVPFPHLDVDLDDVVDGRLTAHGAAVAARARLRDLPGRAAQHARLWGRRVCQTVTRARGENR